MPEVLENFVVLEGLDGSGTTTQMKLLKKELSWRGESVFTTCEPSPLPTGRLIRQVLRKEIKMEAETLARLFSADRHEHLYGAEDGIITHLNRGELVICDRYLFSSLAYQSLECGFDLVKELNPFPLPQHLIYVKLSPEDCRERMSTRSQEELFEAEKIQRAIIENYERGMNAYGDCGMKKTVIDGSGSRSEICAEIMKAIGR